MDRVKAISKFAESVVEGHFDAFGVKLVREPHFGQKQPDFGVVSADTKIVAVIEVKSLTKPEFSAEVMEQVRVTTGIRRQMKKADEQFTDADHLPCLLVVDTASTWIPGSPSEIAEAMFGSDVFRVVMYSDGTIEHGFAVDALGFIDGDNVDDPNRRVSAVAIRAHRTVGCLEPSSKSFDDLPNWMQVASRQPHAKLEWNQVMPGIEGLLCTCAFDYLAFVRNPNAALPWPDSLVGPLDDVFAASDVPGRRVTVEKLGVNSDVVLIGSYALDDFK